MAVKVKILKDRDEWLKNRLSGIGGSEISSVIGLNPYMTNIDLWKYKTGIKIPKDISSHKKVKYGNDAEPLLRKLFELDFPEYEMWYEENNCFTNDRYTWAQASLDGMLTDRNGRTGVWECKTTEILNPNQWKKWDGKIPDNYYCQVLMYMAVIEAEFCILKAQIKHTDLDGKLNITTRHYHIERTNEVEEDIRTLMEAGETFWNQNVKGNKAPDLLLPDI